MGIPHQLQVWWIENNGLVLKGYIAMMLNSKDETSRATKFFLANVFFLMIKEKWIVVNPTKVFFQGEKWHKRLPYFEGEKKHHI